MAALCCASAKSAYENVHARPVMCVPGPVPQVFCNGEEVLQVSGTKEKYVVDVWSGNHPFFNVRPSLSLSILARYFQHTPLLK